MKKQTPSRSPKKNVTEERLRATPFSNVSDLDRESREIRHLIWRRFTQAQMADELMTKAEFAFIREEFATGVTCYLGASKTKQICRVFSEGRGIKVEISETLLKDMGEAQSAQFLEGAVRSNLEGFGTLYYKMRSMLCGEDSAFSMQANIDEASQLKSQGK